MYVQHPNLYLLTAKDLLRSIRNCAHHTQKWREMKWLTVIPCWKRNYHILLISRDEYQMHLAAVCTKLLVVISRYLLLSVFTVKLEIVQKKMIYYTSTCTCCRTGYVIGQTHWDRECLERMCPRANAMHAVTSTCCW